MGRDREGRVARGRGVLSGDSCVGSVKLQDVVPDADQGPFLLNRGQTSSQELPEPTSVLDLAEDGLDDLFSFGIGLLARDSCQLAFHFLARGEIVGRPATRSRRNDLAVLQTPGVAWSRGGVSRVLLYY